MVDKEIIYILLVCYTEKVFKRCR